MPNQKDLLFAKLAVQKGFLTRDQALDALRRLDAGRARGKDGDLGDLLAAEGAIGEEARRTVLDALERMCDPKSGPHARPRTGSACAPPDLERGSATPDMDPGGGTTRTQSVAPTPAADGMGETLLDTSRPGKPEPGQTVTAAPTEPLDPLVGRVLGGVRVIRLIGQGGMGSVYLGLHEGLDKEVVVKVLPPEFTREPVLIERFRREAKACAKLEHPNVVHVYDVGATEDNIHFIVMEYVRGSSLEDLLTARQAPFPVPEAIGYVRAIAAALGAAHAKGIVHRDVKPANVLVSAEGVVKVTDFGLARDLAADRSFSTTGQVLGTPYFMSPEQCDGQKADHRSDIYSLGVLFYNLVTGQRLFSGPSAASILVKHIHQPPPPPSQVHPSVPAPVERVILKMLEKDPEKRYAGVPDFLADLDRIERSEEPEAPPLWKSRLARALKNRRLLAGIGMGAIALAAILFLLLGGGHGNESSDGAPPATNGSPPGPDAVGKDGGGQLSPDEAARKRELEAMARRLVEELAARLSGGPRIGAGRRALEEIRAFLDGAEKERAKDEAAFQAILDALEMSLREGKLFSRFPEGKDLALDLIAARRKKKDAVEGTAEAEKLASEGKLVAALRLYRAAAEKLPDPARQDADRRIQEIEKELASIGVRWQEDPVAGTFQLDADFSAVEPSAHASQSARGLFATSTGIGLKFEAPLPAERQQGVRLAGRGGAILDAPEPTLGTLDASLSIGIRFPVREGSEPLFTVFLDTNGRKALRVDARYLDEKPPRVEIALSIVEKGLEGYWPKGEGLGGAASAASPVEPARHAELLPHRGPMHAFQAGVRFRGTGDRIVVEVTPLRGDPLAWETSLAATGLGPDDGARLAFRAPEHELLLGGFHLAGTERR